MLLGNGSVLLKTPGKPLGGPLPSAIRISLSLKAGSCIGYTYFADARWNKKSAYPNGYLPPCSWHMPLIAGGMSCTQNIRNTSIISNALGANGLNGSVSMTAQSIFTAWGRLIASGIVTMTAHSIITSAAIAGSIYGSASVTCHTVLTAAIGALAGLTASLSALSSMTAVPKAKGFMAATISQSTDPMNPAAVADAVWNSIAANFDQIGSMGEKLNDAGSASNPWTEMIENGMTAAEIMRIMKAALAGLTSKSGDEWHFRDDADTKDRIVGTVDSDGARTAITVDGS